jgi:hypothetical protein
MDQGIDHRQDQSNPQQTSEGNNVMTQPKQLIQRKIRDLVYLHGVHVKNLTGLEINQHAEYKRLYAEWQGGHITLGDIQDDINEYLKMRENV